MLDRLSAGLASLPRATYDVILLLTDVSTTPPTLLLTRDIMAKIVEALKAGEYGLLPPGEIESRSASAQLGKMYTFTVVE